MSSAQVRPALSLSITELSVLQNAYAVSDLADELGTLLPIDVLGHAGGGCVWNDIIDKDIDARVG